MIINKAGGLIYQKTFAGEWQMCLRIKQQAESLARSQKASQRSLRMNTWCLLAHSMEYTPSPAASAPSTSLLESRSLRQSHLR